MLLSIPFSSVYTKRAKNAFCFYNRSLPQVRLHPVDIKLGLTGGGLGLSIGF